MADGGDMGERVDVPVEALRRGVSRAKTVSIKRWGKRSMEAGRYAYPDVGQHAARPRTRGECPTEGEPCPWVSCSAHLYLDVNERTGSIKLNFPGLEPDELPEPCALRVADRGGQTLEEVAGLMNLTRERVRQLETRTIAQMTGDPGLRSHAGLDDVAVYAPPVRAEPDAHEGDEDEPTWATLRHVLGLAGWAEDAAGLWRRGDGRWMRRQDAKAAALRLWRAA